jgi:hypothetical protein
VRILALLDEEPLDNTLLLHACECPKRSWPCCDLLEDGNGARSGANGLTRPVQNHQLRVRLPSCVDSQTRRPVAVQPVKVFEFRIAKGDRRASPETLQ